MGEAELITSVPGTCYAPRAGARPYSSPHAVQMLQAIKALLEAKMEAGGGLPGAFR